MLLRNQIINYSSLFPLHLVLSNVNFHNTILFSTLGKDDFGGWWDGEYCNVCVLAIIHIMWN